jgi:hypothetical protein
VSSRKERRLAEGMEIAVCSEFAVPKGKNVENRRRWAAAVEEGDAGDPSLLRKS